MRVYNTYYENIDELRFYLNKNDITPNDQILVQIFTGICDTDYITNLIHDVKSLLPEVKIIGSTTDGEILNNIASENKTVLSISVFHSTQIETYSSDMQQSSYDTANSLIKKIKKTSVPKLLITFSDGIHTNGQEYVKAFHDFDNSLVIAGGLAGDNAKFEHTYVFTQDGIKKNGAVAVAFYNEDLIVNTNYNFNWESIGKVLTVTNAKDNIVYTIDDIPAVMVYKTYLGDDIYKKLPATGIEFPLIIKRSGIDVARAVLAKNDDGSLTFAGNITKGEKVQFGFGNVGSIIDKRLDIAHQILNNPTEAIFVYSCMARKHLLKDSIPIELKPLTQIADVSGFFTYGEIFHNQKTKINDLLNQTMTTVSISENTEVQKDVKLDEKYNDENIQTIKALCHLTSVSSKELNELNTNLTNIVNEKTYELRVKNKKLLQGFYYDELTTLGNRNLLVKDISSSPEDYSLISIDINNFKNINDLYGVYNGDEILKQFARLLIKIKKNPHCRVFRVSGDEFAILNKKPKDDNYSEMVKYINESVAENSFYMNFGGEKISIDINITIGIANKTKNLIEKAHLALIQAKEARKAYKLYVSDLKLEKDIITNIKYTKIIKDAIKNDKVIVYFQEIVSNDKILKYETLMRIEHDDEIITPFKFLDIAKKNGDYLDLTKIIIQKSFEIFSKRDEKFSINISFEDIADKHTVEFLKQKIKQYNISNQLIIEILEDENIKDYELMKKFVFELKDLNIEIALDDFGSGYSNFSRVLELNVDYIKIDGSIISTIDTNTNSFFIAQTITEFSKKLGIRTIAEFIHSKEVYEKAKEMGIDEFQGFFFGEPKAF